MHSSLETARRWALELGFDRAGVAALVPSRHGKALTRWVERGDHAGMEFMERRLEDRLDPRRLLSGARSALCVASQYHPHDQIEPEDSLWRGVARYARGRDYHNWMGRRLRKLAARLRQEMPGVEARAYVDTGSVLERELCEAAGLGAVGKNTMLLDADAGSWFFLGVVLTTLETEAMSPPEDPCGSCTKCLEACPTGALPEPYRLDARRCISYWTIEHRGGVPESVRPELDSWWFGCDICQEVCPWNEAPSVLGRPEYSLRAAHDLERSQRTLSELIEMSSAQYQRWFRGSPMQRARREGLRRNAILLAGNRREKTVVRALERTLQASDSVLRGHAAWALGQIGHPGSADCLEEAAQLEGDPEARLEMRRARERLAAGA